MNYILGIGSNLGNREQLIFTAIEQIKALPHCRCKKQSSIIETKPVGNTAQPDFLNCAIEIEIKIKPEELMKACLRIEKKMGRARKIKWEPRLIDIDVILFEAGVYDSELITLPHPECHQRKFVLQSLVEICPDWVHPSNNKTIKKLYEELS